MRYRENLINSRVHFSSQIIIQFICTDILLHENLPGNKERFNKTIKTRVHVGVSLCSNMACFREYFLMNKLFSWCIHIIPTQFFTELETQTNNGRAECFILFVLHLKITKKSFYWAYTEPELCSFGITASQNHLSILSFIPLLPLQHILFPRPCHVFAFSVRVKVGRPISKIICG